MLTCYGDRVRLPQNDLVYVAFRLAALDNSLTCSVVVRACPTASLAIRADSCT